MPRSMAADHLKMARLIDRLGTCWSLPIAREALRQIHKSPSMRVCLREAQGATSVPSEVLVDGLKTDWLTRCRRNSSGISNCSCDSPACSRVFKHVNSPLENLRCNIRTFNGVSRLSRTASMNGPYRELLESPIVEGTVSHIHEASSIEVLPRGAVKVTSTPREAYTDYLKTYR